MAALGPAKAGRWVEAGGRPIAVAGAGAGVGGTAGGRGREGRGVGGRGARPGGGERGVASVPVASLIGEMGRGRTGSA